MGTAAVQLLAHHSEPAEVTAVCDTKDVERPVIDRTYASDDVVEATRYVEACQKTGNVVLRVSGGG